MFCRKAWVVNVLVDKYSAFTLTWLMSFIQTTLNFHCFLWLKENNSTWKSLIIIQVRVNGLYSLNWLELLYLYSPYNIICSMLSHHNFLTSLKERRKGEKMRILISCWFVRKVMWEYLFLIVYKEELNLYFHFKHFLHDLISGKLFRKLSFYFHKIPILCS